METSCPRAVLENRLNIVKPPPRNSHLYLPTPPKEVANAARKRSAKKHAQENKRKRAKVHEEPQTDIEDESDEEDPSLFEENNEETIGSMQTPVSLHARARRRTVLHSQSLFASTQASFFRRLPISTRPILQSFVSSLKTDVFKCQAIDVNSFLTPPYACSYSNVAKQGGLPLLAVATEEGSVQILNTSKRNPWDSEPTRTTLQPHYNGVFDVRWDRTDERIATCSGDHSARITSIAGGKTTSVLFGHESTIKTIRWDPTNDALLASGGRDGAICLWDLRITTSKSEDGIHIHNPVIVIPGAHEDPTKPKARKSKKNVPIPKTVTGLIYPRGEPYGLISSGAFDGILRFWDLRTPATPRRSRSTASKSPPISFSSPIDPTTLNGSKRPRGIISLAEGTGSTAGLVFGMGQDSKIHTYTLPLLTPQSINYAEVGMQANSFYVGLALSPCGKWLACGASSPKSSSFLFDVSGAARLGSTSAARAVELQGQRGEVGAVDWADGMVATCTDDGMVRIWRPDIEVYRQCETDPSEAQWDWCWSRSL